MNTKRRVDNQGDKSASRLVDVTLIRDRAHYHEVVMDALARARVSVWIATANVKGVRVEAPMGTRARARGAYVSILELFDGLAARGVELRMLHAGVPSRAFREDLRKQKRLAAGALAMRRCPRVHLKMIAVDGALLYLGSANFTGAGLGAKSDRRRNFEAGVLTDDDVLLDEMQATFDRIWTGKECPRCALRAQCPAPIDGLLVSHPARAKLDPSRVGAERSASSASRADPARAEPGTRDVPAVPAASRLRPRGRSRKSGA